MPAGVLPTSIAVLANVTGVSIGWAGTLPDVRTDRVRGRMTADRALTRLLRGTQLRAVRVGANAYRIEPAAPPARPPIMLASAPARRPVPRLPLGPEEILVTAQKRSQSLLSVAGSLDVIDPLSAATGLPAPAARDIALQTEGLALTNLGPGKNRQFIRGVADSAFNGPSQSTVAVQLDETRLTFNAPDPDLRLVDVERIEILKGPQGPLYGSGALGGIYRIVTRKPDLDTIQGMAGVSSQAITQGGVGIGGEAVLNLPILAGRLAVRGVGYAARDGGWIDDPGGEHNTNTATTVGGRLALRWQPLDDWTVDLSGIRQTVDLQDSQYVTGDGARLVRATRLREPTDNDFSAATASVDGRLGTLRLFAAASVVDQGSKFALDAREAAARFGRTGPALFRSAGRYRLADQEIRLAPIDGRQWIVGVSSLRAHSVTDAVLDTSTDSLPVERLDRETTEMALFGEATFAVASRLGATIGARVSRTVNDDEALERSTGSADRKTKIWLSPSVALTWRPSASSTVYLRYARSLRPGGLAADDAAVARRFDSDELGTYDLGYRARLAGGTLLLSASTFYTTWTDLQSDYLLDNGLVSTRNAGSARIIGAEASARWRVSSAVELSGGAAFVNALLLKTEDGSKLDDRHLPITPDVTARFGGRWGIRIGRWSGSVSGQANYIGRSRLSFDGSLDRGMGNYVTTSAAAEIARNGFAISARIDNVLNTRGDSFAFGNPFSIREQAQFTPLRPRTFTLSLSRAW